MLRSVEELYGYTLRATDDTIGSVHDFLIADESWKIRYVVVDTGTWLPGRKVLISPEAFGNPDWSSMMVPVKLTRDQVKNSPDINTEMPVTREQETALREHYDWPLYWGGWMAPAGTTAYWPSPAELHRIPQPAAPRGTAVETAAPVERHLRSTREISGHHIQATDAEIGHVHDFAMDDEDWTIRYLIVDTRNWIPGRKVLIATAWVEGIDWNERKVDVGLTKEGVKNSPEFDPDAPVNRHYEETLYDYYGRPKYWSS